MPVIIKDYDWSQTGRVLSVSVQLEKGITAAQVDTFVTPNYVKLSWPKSRFVSYLNLKNI